MRAHSDAVGDGVAYQIRHRVVFVQHTAKVELLGVARQQAFTFQQPPHPDSDGVSQLRQLGRRRFGSIQRHYYGQALRMYLSPFLDTKWLKYSTTWRTLSIGQTSSQSKSSFDIRLVQVIQNQSRN